MTANIYKYCPKHLHSNAHTVKLVNSTESGVICGPECVFTFWDGGVLVNLAQDRSNVKYAFNIIC